MTGLDPAIWCGRLFVKMAGHEASNATAIDQSFGNLGWAKPSYS